jgi:hypothetical protein
MSDEKWILVRDRLPPLDTPVMTKIDDANGVRNEQTLLLYRNLWWFKDKSMYVYYEPTHWRPL